MKLTSEETQALITLIDAFNRPDGILLREFMYSRAAARLMGSTNPINTLQDALRDNEDDY